jgi:hypothetical protein
MAYSEKAKELRRCKAIRRDGQPCQAWALWGSDKCAAHTYKQRRVLPPGYHDWPTRNPPCNCAAYAWPHRPGSGLCNWPDPPTRRSTIAAGTHSYLRSYKRQYRVLLRRWGQGF